jgi:hypothetical protein
MASLLDLPDQRLERLHVLRVVVRVSALQAIPVMTIEGNPARQFPDRKFAVPRSISTGTGFAVRAREGSFDGSLTGSTPARWSWLGLGHLRDDRIAVGGETLLKEVVASA